MGEIPSSIPVPLTKPRTLQQIWDAKRVRRERLAKLSIDERAKLMEKLQEMGRAMIGARVSIEERNRMEKPR